MRKYWKVELESGVVIIPPSDSPQTEIETIRKHKVKAILARLNRSNTFKRHLKDNPSMSSIKRVLDSSGNDVTCSLVHNFNKALMSIVSKKNE